MVALALLYPWATKEYVLWQMTIGQAMYYHNAGVEMKYGKSDRPQKQKTVADMTYEELVAKRAELRAQYGEIGNG